MNTPIKTNPLHNLKRWQWLCIPVLGALFAYACSALSLPESEPKIETLVQRAVRADCPSKGLCDQLIIESAILEDVDRHYYLVRVPMPFEALADIISYRLVACDPLNPTCTVIDGYDGEFGVVEVVTDTGQPYLHWKPFSP